MKPKYYWFDASTANNPVFHRYIADRPRRYFGDVYRKQGTGKVESKIWRDNGCATFKAHKSIAEAKTYVETEANHA